jgi:hypothetical protein
LTSGHKNIKKVLEMNVLANDNVELYITSTVVIVAKRAKKGVFWADFNRPCQKLKWQNQGLSLTFGIKRHQFSGFVTIILAVFSYCGDI